MAIKKRLTPEARFDSSIPHWRSILSVPMIKSMTRGIYPIDTSPANLNQIIQSFGDARWITAVPMDHKIFMYACGLVARRAGVVGFLSEDKYTQLGRHLAALSTLDKIDKSDGVNFAFRQCFLWDIPAFRERYPTDGSFQFPAPPRPPRPKRVRLAKHR